MQKIFFLLCCIMLSFIVHAQKHNLFNGKDLSGWTIHGTEKWYVDAGELVCESGPDKQYGYLSTQKQYKNFILTLSFKPEADGNSGVFIRSGIEGTKISGWQVEVAPPGHNSGGIYESYGRGWLIKPKDEDQQLVKMGSWNTMRIKVQGDVVSSWINGKIVIDGFRDEKIGKGEGFIALQIHDGGGIKIRWKDLAIEELPVQ
ncbi:MAG: DUF1080 domain-containing protein [Chitinophagaceae bacterium]|nr:DUF1080 domain-containing protein [Chitinophagaceae bacterium]